MPCGFVTSLTICEYDVTHLVVALKHADSSLEEGISEGRVHNIRRVVAKHLSHVLGKDFLIDLLEPDHVPFRELRAVSNLQETVTVLRCVQPTAEPRGVALSALSSRQRTRSPTIPCWPTILLLAL